MRESKRERQRDADRQKKETFQTPSCHHGEMVITCSLYLPWTCTIQDCLYIYIFFFWFQIYCLNTLFKATYKKPFHSRDFGAELCTTTAECEIICSPFSNLQECSSRISHEIEQIVAGSFVVRVLNKAVCFEIQINT